MSNNIVDMRSRKPLEEAKRDEERESEAIAQSNQQEIDACLKWIDTFRENVAAGHFVSPMLIAYAPESGCYFNDIFVQHGLLPHLAAGYVAQLEMSKLNMLEILAGQPILQVDNRFVEPSEILE